MHDDDDDGDGDDNLCFSFSLLHQLQHVTKALILFWPHSQSTALTSSVFCVFCFSTGIETNWRRMSQMFHLNAAKKRFVKGCIPERRKLEKTNDRMIAMIADYCS